MAGVDAGSSTVSRQASYCSRQLPRITTASGPQGRFWAQPQYVFHAVCNQVDPLAVGPDLALTASSS